MNRVIRNYSKMPSSLREEVYKGYSESELERTTFPYQGQITDGVIYKTEDIIYLIPISTIIAGRSGSSDDLDDNDDDEEPIGIEIEDDSEE